MAAEPCEAAEADGVSERVLINGGGARLKHLYLTLRRQMDT